MPRKEDAERTREQELKTPPLVEIAARIRDGETCHDLAKQYDIDRQGLANRLRHGGYRFDTGETERAAQLREMKEHLTSKLRTYSLPWMQEAACAQVGGDLWFPEKGGSTADAKRVCFSCSVSAECLEYALATKDRFGVYGGLSERERRKLLKERAA